jgi:TPR repeat protein
MDLAHIARQQDSLDRADRLRRMTRGELSALLRGAPADIAPWVESAAASGVAAAQTRWAAMLLDGQGVTADPALARHWFLQAARRGDAEAMNMLGRCCENGWGGDADWPQAALWYRRSAEAGHDWGEYNFANMLFDGRGVAADRPLALVFYRRAADRGHGRAMNLLGRCAESGWGCDRNRDLAALWYARSAESGYFRGQFNHGCLLLEDGRLAEALHWLRLAASAGDAPLRRQITAILRAAGLPAFARDRPTPGSG